MQLIYQQPLVTVKSFPRSASFQHNFAGNLKVLVRTTERALVYMHVVRNVAPICKAFPVQLCRRSPSAATTPTESVIRRLLSSESHDKVANSNNQPSLILDPEVPEVVKNAGFERFKDLLALQPESDNTISPPLGKLARRKLRKRLKAALSQSKDVLPHPEYVTKDLSKTIEKMHKPVPMIGPKNLTASKKAKQKSLPSSIKVHGWKGEEWGSDGRL
jgi:hypothetical protein